jgi:hypothetical protein
MAHDPVRAAVTHHVPTIRLDAHHAGEKAILSQGPPGEGVSKRDQDEAQDNEPGRKHGRPPKLVIQPRHDVQREGYTHRHQPGKDLVPRLHIGIVAKFNPFCKQPRVPPFCPHAPPYTSHKDQQGIEPGLPPFEIQSADQQDQRDEKIGHDQTNPLVGIEFFNRLWIT